jgi:uncharacterized protein involved in type VI secretion and phage assembly
VVVEFIEGDIDRPVITGGVYNGVDAPPFAAGENSSANHPGFISGWHSQSLDFADLIMASPTGSSPVTVVALTSYEAHISST